MTRAVLSLEAYKEMVGQEIGLCDWLLIDQQRVDAFADITEDRQYIHIDPVAAAATPFGGTVAHGFLIMSMLSAMVAAATPSIEGAAMAVNYGMNNLHFIRPVRAGKRIRARFTLLDLKERTSHQWQTTLSVKVEIEGEEKPSIVVEWSILYLFDQA